MTLSARKRTAFALVAGLLSLIVAVVAGELLVRRFADTRLTAEVYSNEPTTHESDPDLGWRSKAGHYEYAGYTPDAPRIHMTFLPGSRRATGSAAPDGAPRILLTGCSFTEGWAISDEETYAWQLQQRFPSVEIVNGGVGGYGTYQALLTMERFFGAASNPPALVVYAMMDLHPSRNIAAWWWLRGLTRQTQRGHIELPYCTLDRSGKLIRHAPVAYPQWPLRRHLALVRFAEDTAMRIACRRRSGQRHEVTQQLLLEMKRLCDRRGAAFLVALLSFGDESEKARYTAFMERNGIPFRDCIHPKTPDMEVAGEGHPNGKMNRLWADDIAPAIRPWASRPEAPHEANHP